MFCCIINCCCGICRTPYNILSAHDNTITSLLDALNQVRSVNQHVCAFQQPFVNRARAVDCVQVEPTETKGEYLAPPFAASVTLQLRRTAVSRLALLLLLAVFGVESCVLCACRAANCSSMGCGASLRISEDRALCPRVRARHCLGWHAACC